MTYRQKNLTQHLGEALNNMGLAYTQLGQLDDAQAAYEEAVAHYGASGDTPRRLLALINSAELWIAKREYDRAVSVCVNVLVEAELLESWIETAVAEDSNDWDERVQAENLEFETFLGPHREDLKEPSRRASVRS